MFAEPGGSFRRRAVEDGLFRSNSRSIWSINLSRAAASNSRVCRCSSVCRNPAAERGADGHVRANTRSGTQFPGTTNVPAECGKRLRPVSASSPAALRADEGRPRSHCLAPAWPPGGMAVTGRGRQPDGGDWAARAREVHAPGAKLTRKHGPSDRQTGDSGRLPRWHRQCLGLGWKGVDTESERSLVSRHLTPSHT